MKLREPMHHAYCLAGSSERIIRALLTELAGLGIATQGNPDLRVERFEVFGIDEALALREAAARASITGERKIFIVAAEKLTREAQNALLKTFEEPLPRTHFFLLVPIEESVLPTLRSRMRCVNVAAVSAKKVAARAAAFVAGSVSLRLKTASSLVAGLDDEGGRARLFQFLDALEYELAKGPVAERAETLRALLLAKRYGRDRAPSFKLLLEHLALSL